MAYEEAIEFYSGYPDQTWSDRELLLADLEDWISEIEDILQWNAMMSHLSSFFYAILVIAASIIIGLVVRKKMRKPEKTERERRTIPKSFEIHCPHCGSRINPEDVFCSNCGKSREKRPKEEKKEPEILKKFICPFCKNEIGEDWVSCPYCGVRLKNGNLYLI